MEESAMPRGAGGPITLLAIAFLAPFSPPPADRLALTISGGASLGNYEAGLTWASVRYLRTPPRQIELAAVTGASAGAANAVMAAAMWCEDWTETHDDDPDKIGRASCRERG